MFRAKDHKTGHLFEPFDFLGPKRVERIKQSRAGLFRKEILAELPVELTSAAHLESISAGCSLHCRFVYGSADLPPMKNCFGQILTC